MQRFLTTSALCATGLIAATGASAQTTPAASTTADAGDLNEIVVTAQRREQSAQDVGIALSVVTPQELIKRGITNINELQQTVPSLEIEPAFGSGQAEFRLRGVGFQDYASNNSPTVGVYVNEVAYPVPVMTQSLIFDIARIEVLRGPQGTLYGRNTTGGAINFITNKPTDDYHAGGFVEYGRFDQLRGEAYVSGPLGGGLKFRLSGATEQGGAYQYNRVDGRSLGDADKLAGRALLAYDNGGAFTALVDFHGGRDHGENVGLYLLDDFQTSVRPGVKGPIIPADSNHRQTGWSISPQLARDANLPGDKPGRRNWTYGTSLNARYDFGGVALTSITSYDELHRNEYGDYDASSSVEADVFFGSRITVFSEEARLSSSGSGPFTWVAGVYYSDQRLREKFYSDFTANFGTYARVNYYQTVHSVAGFGQAEYAVTPKLNVIAGVRYEDEKRTLNGFGSAFGGAQALPPTTVSTKITPVSGKVAVEFKPVSNILLYASASKGVKSGGFTTYNTGNASGIAPFKPEKLYAYEVGFKADIDRAIQVNGSTFYYDYRDQQVQDYVCGANGPVGKFVNAKKSRIYGVEGEVRLTPIAGLSIAPYASYKNGKFLDFGGLDLPYCSLTHLTRFIDKSGTRIAFPKVEFGGNVSYEIPFGDFFVTPSSTFSYRSLGYSPLKIDRFNIPHYWLVNADLTVGPQDGRWSLAVWGRNLFDKDYDLTRNFFTTSNIAQPGRPRSYGVRAGFKI